MKSAFRLLPFVVLLTIGVATAQVSKVSTGQPPFGSLGGGPFDIVNLGNLNVHLAIPVLHKAGRGMPFSYDLSYDSSIWQPVASSGTTQWQPASNWGWRGQTEAKLGYIEATIQSVTCPNPQDPNKPLMGTRKLIYAYHDPFGRIHPFDIEVLSGACGQSRFPIVVTAYDGSGYTLTVPNLFGSTITTVSGQVVTPAGISSGAGSAIDANGNEITVNTSGQFFDTLSSTTPVLTVSSAAPPTPTTFTYTAPSGGNASYTVNYQQYTVRTNFGFSNIVEYGPLNNALVSNIVLPDGTSYVFTYEATPGTCTPLSGTYSANCITGRIASVTLPTGGEITYAYSGGSNGIESDGSTAGLSRTLSPGGLWQYSRALQAGSTPVGPGSTWTTTVIDPRNNNTVLSFAEDGASSIPTYNFYETQRQIYQGSVSPSNLLATTIRCYNINYANCSTAVVTSPITQTDAYSQLPNGSTRLSEVVYSSLGLVTDAKEYDYGVATGTAPGNTHLIRETVTTYATLGNGISNRPASVVVKDWSSGTATTLASTTYTYDGATPTATTGTPQHVAITGSRGLLTSVSMQVSGSAPGGTALPKSFTYYDTGTPNVATDVNGAQTTYVYGSGSCGNSFPTTINGPLGLSHSTTWNCTGGTATQVTDENGQNLASSYTDSDFWRPASVTDQLNNQTNVSYLGPTAVEGALQNFNGGSSTSDSRTTVDGFGRPLLSQRLQGPSSTHYDTVETDYNNVGQLNRSTMPFSAVAGGTNATAPATTTTYDAMGRVLTVTDANGGTVAYTYTNNDVLQKVSGPQTFQKRLEYDGLGRLTSVCEISSSLTGTGTCNQSTSQTGYWTKYTYDALGHLLTVTQNAQASSGQQTRTFTYDMLGRMLTESNPETGNSGVNGTVTYTFDSVSSCGGAAITSNGDLVKKTDNAGNATCYSYDSLHRVIAAGNSTISGATLRKFVYDTKASFPTGVTVVNAKTRMVEAQTTNAAGSTVLTDEYFSYDARGELTDVYESTPHSSGFYHTTAAYWPTGMVKTLSGIPGVPTINYGANGSGLDGEGRITQVTASSGASPVTAVTYSPGTSTAPLGALTNVTFGSADSDSFTYDPNTGRMATYTFSVNSNADTGTLTWNTNGTLQKLIVNDLIPGTADSQTCTYGYDDLRRVSNATCGTLWAQNFTYDAFGNITKNVPPGDGGLSFLPSYWTTPPTNQFSSLPGVTVSYDANGNLLTDNLNTYTWDANWGTMTTVTVGSTTVTPTYDALGRMVENNLGGTYREFVYGPTGTRLANVNGTTLLKAYVALPGGAKAIYNSTGLAYYRHSDWLGSSRLTSTAARGLYSSSAYAPFGEQYATSGTFDASFTGQDHDTVGNLYDFPARRQSPSQGRWISPDPLGRGAVALTNPQTWNRYVYVNNNPLRLIDAMGLDSTCVEGINQDELPTENDDNNSDGGATCVIDGSGDGSGDMSGDGSNTSDPGATEDSPCSANVTVGAIGGITGISPSLPIVLENTRQYFQQAGISLSFNYQSQPSNTLDFGNTAQMKAEGELINVPGQTDCANNGAGCESWINTEFIAQEMVTAGPGASYVQGVTSTVEHELIHNLTGNQVINSPGEDTSDIMGGASDSDYYASPPITQSETIALQTATCPQGDFGGNSGPVDAPPPDVPAIARPKRH